MRSKKRLKILVILFGTLEFDGRMRRILDILHPIGEVFLIDITSKKIESSKLLDNGEQRHSVCVEGQGQFVRHLHFASVVYKRARVFKPDVVFAANFFTTITGYICARRHAAKLLYDAYELIIPENGVKMSWRDRFWYMLEKFVVPSADLVIAANPERAKLMAEHYSLGDEPAYMRNIPPLHPVSPYTRELAVRHYPVLRLLYDKKVVLYQGDISLSRGIDRFVSAMSHLPSNVYMLVAGSGPDWERLNSIGEKLLETGRLALLGRVPQNILPAIAEYADVGIVTYPYDGLNNIFCAPNKIFEYAQGGVPVVATDQPPLKYLVEKYQIGVLVAPEDDSKAIADKIHKIISDQELYREKLPIFVSAHLWEQEKERVTSRIKKALVSENLV